MYKSFIRHKVFGEKEYAYEVTHYYDEREKRVRQKVKYLGKVTERGIERVRGLMVEKPRCAVDYGDIYFMEQIVKELKLDKILGQLFKEKERNIFLILAINRVISGVSLDNLQSWYESTYLKVIYPIRKGLSGQSLSRFLKKTGQGEREILEFFLCWWEKIEKNVQPLFYDISSLSSYSNSINLLEYGYNRDNESLPQINIGLVVLSESNLPVYYKIFPGSIPDVKTLKNLMTEIKILGKGKPLLILDKGFYSIENIKELKEDQWRFIIPLPFSRKIAQFLIQKEKKNLFSPVNVRKYQDGFIYTVKGEVQISKVKLFYYLYHDLERETREKIKFYRQLSDIEEKLEEREIKKGEKPEQVFRDITGNFSIYFSYKIVNNHFQIKRKEKNIKQLLSRLGKEILLSSEDLLWDLPLSVYRGKEKIEKCFRAVKNELSGLPLRVHKEETLKGYLFITFLSLILYFYILNKMRETKLIKKITMENLFLELRKLRWVEFKDKGYLTEISKKQTEIFKQFGILMPKI